MRLLQKIHFIFLSLTLLTQVQVPTIAFAQTDAGLEKPPENKKLQGAIIKSKNQKDGREFEVLGFQAQNAQQGEAIASNIQSELKEVIKEYPNATFEIQVRTDSSNNNTKALDYEAYLLAHQIASVDKDKVKISEVNQPISPFIQAKYLMKRLHQKAYRVSFALVRGGANGALTTWYLMATAQMSLDAAMTVGSVVGSMSFSLQYWSKQVYAWAEKSTGTLATVFDRYRDKVIALQERASVWNRAESYGRAYLIEIVYVGILHTSINAMNAQLDISSYDAFRATIAHVLITGLWGFTQDTWDLSITEIRNRMEKIKRLTQNQINFRINTSYFAVAGVSMLLLLAQLHKTPNIEFAYITMGLLGAGTYLWTWTKSKKLDKDIAKHGEKSVIHPTPLRDLKCHIVLRKL